MPPGRLPGEVFRARPNENLPKEAAEQTLRITNYQLSPITKVRVDGDNMKRVGTAEGI